MSKAKTKLSQTKSQKFTLINIFVSSPGDVIPERDCVFQVAERLNRNLGNFLKIRLNVLDWRKDVCPDMGRPQEVINQQICDYDIFLGIMWKCFGTPSGKADSGTEEEFRIAYQNWQKYKRPRILFYFKQEPFMPRTNEEIAQFGKVMAFKDEFWNEQKGLVLEFPSTPEFKETIYDHLHKILTEKFKPAPGATLPPDFTRYLEYLQAETRYLDIRGLAARSNQPNQFQINQLYIPLTTPGLPGRSRLNEVPLQTALKYKRLLIKGDPGAGKTTFLKLLVFHLASLHQGEVVPIGETQLEWPEPLPLPVWVRLGELCDFIQDQRKNHAENAPGNSDNPEWLIQFLADRGASDNWKVTGAQLKQELDAGHGLILLDGLDEAPDEKVRRNIAELTGKICHAYPKCPVIITSRPVALEDVSLPADFETVDIAELSEHAMSVFLEQWCRQLYPEAPEKSQQHLAELKDALHTRPEIRQMARTPVMLTMLAVIHWNENKLPEQRAELYKSIIRWLLESKEKKSGRLGPTPRQKLLQKLALEMFCHPDGRQRQVGLRWAAEQIQARFKGDDFNNPVEQAENFLRQEMLDSGVIVERNRRLEFWHLSFQEYLAAVEIGGFVAPDDRVNVLFKNERLFQSEWREVVLLLAGVLYGHGEEQINHLFDAVIDREMPEKMQIDDLPRLARAVGLLGGMVNDLRVFTFQPKNPDYPKLVQQVMGIFDKKHYQTVPLRIRIEAADTLGQVGDPRFLGDPATRWVEIPGGTFRMGAQNKNESERNYDVDARDREFPVHLVKLSPYSISKYLVTVGEYQRFIEADGYEQEKFWQAGGFKEFSEPKNWTEQQAFPTRPVVYVSWYEAAAYAAWAGCRLPTEAEWERAARGPGEDYRKYPWGNTEPEEETTNWRKTSLRHVAPVGIFPEDCSPEGVLELAGNAWEWCGDWFAEDYYVQCGQLETNPTGPKNGSARVLRGGAFDSDPVDLRCADRLRSNPDSRCDYVGFRVVRRAES